MGSRGSADPTHEGRDGLLPVRGFFPRRREIRLQAPRPHTLPGCAPSANLTAISVHTPGPHGCDRKGRTVLRSRALLFRRVGLGRARGDRLVLGRRRCLLFRRPAMQQSAICSVEQINLESRKAGPEPAKLWFSCFPAFQILSPPPRVFIRARATPPRLLCSPLPIAPVICGRLVMGDGSGNVRL